MRMAKSKSRWAGIPLAAAGMLLSSLACNSIPFLAHTPTPTATSTPTPTETPTRTNTPTITPTFTPSLTPTQSYLDWPVVLSDGFDDNSHEWFVGDEKDDFLTANVSITNGQYLVDITAVKGVFWSLLPIVRNLSDFYLTADVEKKTGSTDSNYGLVFRIGSGNKYYFYISTDSQEYSFFMFANDEWTMIISSTPSSRINGQGTNLLAVLARGSNFTFFINGEIVDQIEDNTLKMGKVGVGMSMAKAGDKMELAFDNFEVRAPKAGV